MDTSTDKRIDSQIARKRDIDSEIDGSLPSLPSDSWGDSEAQNNHNRLFKAITIGSVRIDVFKH